jgi:hypothetical protein
MDLSDTPLTGTNLVAGEERAAGERTFGWVDPRTGAAGDVTFAEATAEEVRAATAAAATASAELATWPDDRGRDELPRQASTIVCHPGNTCDARTRLRFAPLTRRARPLPP